MNKQSYSQILDRVAREHMAEHIDLAPRILTSIEKGKRRTMQPRIKVFVTAIVVLLILMTVAISVPAVRAAIQRWIGYVPGIGFVSEGQIRVLAEPVSITRDGITLRLEKVVADSVQTTVVYSVTGLTRDMLDFNHDIEAACPWDATLRLPKDESPLLSGPQTVGYGETGQGYQAQARYPVLPATINEATLVIPCLPSTLRSKAPGNWEISFRLIPAPPELTAFPVIDIPTSSAAPGNVIPQANTNPLTAGVYLTLDRAVQMEDGYVLYGTLHWKNSSFSAMDVMGFSAIRLLDASGQDVPQHEDYDAVFGVPYESGKTFIAVKTEPIQIPGPLTLIVDSAYVQVDSEASFTFDPGPHPQPGQVWELNQDLDLGHGYALRVLRVTYPKDSPQPGFSFEMESDTGVSQAFLIDVDHRPAQTGGFSVDTTAKRFHRELFYEQGIPEGPIQIKVLNFSVLMPGPWQAQWTPPLSNEQTTANSQPPACLTRESWEQALQQAPALPPELGGMLALFEPLSPGYLELSVARLDGRDRKLLGHGYLPSFSPDGTRLVYVGTKPEGGGNGLYVAEVASGETMRLPGTTGDDMDPLWSPDGQKIVFTHRPARDVIDGPRRSDIMVIDVDDWSSHKLVTGFEDSIARAWMPDGNHILYVAGTQDGGLLQILDLQTGESSPLFETWDAVSLSPDGTRLVFGEMASADKYSLFVSDLDGTNRKRLTDGYPYNVNDPVWSPDGKWIIVSVADVREEIMERPILSLALIQVDTCQIIPLSNLTGYVSSWLP